MRSYRIYILTPHTLLTRGVEILLDGRPSFQVVGAETDVQRSLEDIERLRPDVVILGHGNGSSVSLDDVSRVFGASPGTAVISMGASENILHVYQDDQVTVANVEDLVQAIQRIQRPVARAARRQGQ